MLASGLDQLLLRGLRPGVKGRAVPPRAATDLAPPGAGLVGSEEQDVQRVFSIGRQGSAVQRVCAGAV